MADTSSNREENDWFGNEMLDPSRAIARPRGRWRTAPKIPATPYSRHIPATPVKISRSQYAAEWIRYGLHNRPDPGEAMVWLWVHSFYIVGVGSVAVAAADQVFNLGLADSLAQVKVDPHAGGIEQTIQQIAHDIGESAGGEAK